MPPFRKLATWALIATWPVILMYSLQQVTNLSSFLFPSAPEKPITDERKAELLATMGPEFRHVMTAPPYCWGYKGPRRVWPEQGQWTESTFKDFMANKEKREKAWLESIGKTPPLTCEEYEGPAGTPPSASAVSAPR